MRWVMGGLGAIVALAIELVAFPFMLSLLKHAGVPVPSGGMGTLSTGVNRTLLFLNWLIYAGLGFFFGMMLAGRKRPQEQRAGGQ